MLMLLWVVVSFVAYRVYDWWKRRPWIGDLDKKCVLVTGCDSGFGNQTAKSLCNRGVHVFAGCFTEEGARKLREETGGRVQTVSLDVSQTESIQAAYQYVKERIPPGTEFWGLVNNAGMPGIGGPLEFMTRDDYRTVMEVNCFGPIELTQVFLPLIKKSKGRIVNTSSMVGEVAIPGAFPYAISKFAIRGFSEALSYEKDVWGIHVAVVEPGCYKTNILNVDDFMSRATKRWEELNPDIREEYGQEYHDKSIAAVSASLKSFARPNLGPVVEAYEHALFSQKPHHKYKPGMDCKITTFLNDYLPHFMMHKLITKVFSGILPKVLKKES